MELVPFRYTGFILELVPFRSMKLEMELVPFPFHFRSLIPKFKGKIWYNLRTFFKIFDLHPTVMEQNIMKNSKKKAKNANFDKLITEMEPIPLERNCLVPRPKNVVTFRYVPWIWKWNSFRSVPWRIGTSSGTRNGERVPQHHWLYHFGRRKFEFKHFLAELDQSQA